MKTSTRDRRGAPRQAAHGPVRLWLASAVARSIEGELIDVSAEGFRASHPCLTLSPGSRVEFEFGGQRGTARAVWNRIVGETAETGFSILAG